MKKLLLVMLCMGTMLAQEAHADISPKVKAALDRGDTETAVRLLTPQAQRGNGDAQYNLWAILKSTDNVLAEQWLTKAAKAKHGMSCLTLGRLMIDRLKVGEDWQPGVAYIRCAANQGVSGAESDLGDIMRNGPMVFFNEAEAFKWSLKAARKGEAKAQFNLAVYYHYGYGTVPDSIEARKWAEASAKQGYEPAKKLMIDLVH